MPRKIVLLLGIMVLIVILLIGVSLFGKKRVSTPIPPEVPTQPTSFSAPSLPPLPTTRPNPSIPFKVMDVIPGNDPSIRHLPIKQVAFYFSQNISPADLKYTVSPQAPSQVFTEEGYPNMLIISPRPSWTRGITTITIQTSTKSSSGEVLSESYVYRLNTGPLEHPGL